MSELEVHHTAKTAMRRECFSRLGEFEAPADLVFAWHAQPGAFQRLCPPWESVDVVEAQGIEAGARTTLVTRAGPIVQRWVAEHRRGPTSLSFVDVQVEGPFAEWEHLHQVQPLGEQTCTLEDRVRYRLPLGPPGRWFGGGYVRARLARMFEYRHRILAQDLRRHREYGSEQEGTDAMKVCLSGASGLVGSSLSAFLTSGGHEIARLVRPSSSSQGGFGRTIEWSVEHGVANPDELEGFDAIVHLAGENIAAKRWTPEQMAKLEKSRVDGTRHLCEALAARKDRPEVLVCASAIGFYGDRGTEILDENSQAGDGFFPELCEAWEEATRPAREAGIRVVNARFGVILSPAGGALAKMLLPFKLGAGGKLGSGNQFMSWISLDDAVSALHHALRTESLRGPVNVVAPNPVTNAEFTKTLGRVLRRPTIAPMPAFAARLAFGKMADEALLSSARVLPRKLQESGFRFDHPDLEVALRHVLGRQAG